MRESLGEGSRRRCRAACQKLAEAIEELDACGLHHHATHAQLCLDLVREELGLLTRVADQYRIQWARPVPATLEGEHSYHASNGVNHILVIATDKQLQTAARVAKAAQAIDPEASVQQIVEDAINRAIATRPFAGGELRLFDADFL